MKKIGFEGSSRRRGLKKEGAYEGPGGLPGLTVLFVGRKDKVGSLLLSRATRVASAHSTCSVFSNSMANQEDKGAGEDFGLQRFEWLTSCIIDDV